MFEGDIFDAKLFGAALTSAQVRARMRKLELAMTNFQSEVHTQAQETLSISKPVNVQAGHFYVKPVNVDAKPSWPLPLLPLHPLPQYVAFDETCGIFA